MPSSKPTLQANIKLLALTEKNLSPCHNTAIACHWNEGRQGRGVNVQHRTPPDSGTIINIHNNYGEDTARYVQLPPQTTFQLFELVEHSHRDSRLEWRRLLRFITFTFRSATHHCVLSDGSNITTKYEVRSAYWKNATCKRVGTCA